MTTGTPVMIVDDDEMLLEMLKYSLTKSGYDCETFISGEAARERLPSSPARLLISDIAMPGMKGLDLAGEAKRLRPDMSIIIMTGFISEYSFDQAMEAGASDFIKKPFSIEELLLRLKHVDMQKKLKAMSITDELTGLLNRRGFFALAQQQLKMVRRSGGSMVLMFADLDGFKAINDTLGHGRGDEALIAVADIFRKTFRDSDIIARMSGDEFAVILIDASDSTRAVINRRLKENIEVYNPRPQAAYSLSISIGSALYENQQPGSIDELLHKADASMYEQKQLKRR